MVEIAAALGRLPPNRVTEKILGRPATTFREWAARYATELFGSPEEDGGRPGGIIRSGADKSDRPDGSAEFGEHPLP